MIAPINAEFGPEWQGRAEMDKQPPVADTTAPSVPAVPAPVVSTLPVPLSERRAAARRRLRARPWVLLLMLIGAAAGGAWWWLQPRQALPPGIFSGNGRLEADKIDIDTKLAGRIAALRADEGDMVKAGQVLAVMDTQELQASLKKAEAVLAGAHHGLDAARAVLTQQQNQVLRSQALIQQSQRALDEARANFEQQKSQVMLARQELARTQALAPKGFATLEQLDQRRQQVNAALAALNATEARVSEARHALDAATHDAASSANVFAAAEARVGEAEQIVDADDHDVELYRVNIADNSLTAPREGRIQYRVANVGEVLPAGGKVFTMLDTSYVYMDVYLPTAQAGRIRLGSDARIILDAYPAHAIPAHVVFVASNAQFTPKTVETKDERDKLMFRIRVRIDPERLRGRAEAIRSGLPGLAFIRSDPKAEWPVWLQPQSSTS